MNSNDPSRKEASVPKSNILIHQCWLHMARNKKISNEKAPGKCWSLNTFSYNSIREQIHVNILVGAAKCYIRNDDLSRSSGLRMFTQGNDLRVNNRWTSRET